MTIDVVGLPKVELHLHLEGTLEPELIFALATRNRINVPFADVDDLRTRYAFRDLQNFLDLYYSNMSVLLHEQDFADMTRAYLARAAAGGVQHAEVFFDPQAHTERGVPLEVALTGVTEALGCSEREYGISTGLIITFLRDRPAEQAQQMLEEILRFNAPIIGIGLDSAELGHPPSPFRDVFELARASGLRCVAHAGEEGPPAYVWEVLDVLGVSRIDHGIRAIEDEKLVQRLVDERVPLTVCPLSNVRLRAVDHLAEHPIIHMADRGIQVTVNSDDPAYFGGYVEENYRQLAQTFHLDRRHLASLARNGIEAAFVAPDRRAALLANLSTWEHQP
jgi:adenosine deaminase